MKIGLAGNDTKEKIIEILSLEWPLSARKIFMRLTKSYHLSITYQGTHKALKELENKEILKKEMKGYSINKKWINDLGEFSERIGKIIDFNFGIEEEKVIRKLFFDNHSDFIKFHAGFMEHIMQKDGKLDMIFYFRHVPYLHVIPSETLSRLKKSFSKINWKIISKNKSILDKWNAKQWQGIGVKVDFCKDISFDRLIIMNDYIMHVYTSKKSIWEWDKTYSIKNIDKFKIKDISDKILDNKLKTFVTILKDKDIANLIK